MDYHRSEDTCLSTRTPAASVSHLHPTYRLRICPSCLWHSYCCGRDGKIYSLDKTLQSLQERVIAERSSCPDRWARALLQRNSAGLSSRRAHTGFSDGANPTRRNLQIKGRGAASATVQVLPQLAGQFRRQSLILGEFWGAFMAVLRQRWCRGRGFAALGYQPGGVRAGILTPELSTQLHPHPSAGQLLGSNLTPLVP